MTARTPFGEWLRQRRHMLDLTQTTLAEQSGCSAVTIRKLESGERKPSLELAQSLSRILRIPKREQAAFVQFARSDDYEASFRLPAWKPDQVSWRDQQLPARQQRTDANPSGLRLHYDLVALSAPKYEQLEDGRQLVKAQAEGPTNGDIAGTITLEVTQIITPKPAPIGFSQTLPMQIGATFTFHADEDSFGGVYTGTYTPMLDNSGHGQGLVNATGQVITVTPGFINLFLNYVFVEDIIRIVEGAGTGARGTMQLKPAI